MVTDYCDCSFSNLGKPSGYCLQASDLPKLDPHVVSVGVPNSEQATAGRAFEVRWSTTNDEVVVLDPDALRLVTGSRQHPNIQQSMAELIAVEPHRWLRADLH